MKLSNSSRSVPVKKALKLGDAVIFFAAFNSPIWKLIFTDFGKAVLMILGRFMRANSAMMAYMLSAVKGGNHGVLVSGAFLTLTCSVMMIVYNSSYVWSALNALLSFSQPVLPSWPNREWYEVFYDVAFNRIVSIPMLVYSTVFFASSVFHTLKNWSGFGTKEITKRGTSYLYLLVNHCLSKWFTVGEFFINFLETTLIIFVGLALIHYDLDAHFGWFLISIGCNELMTIITDKTAELNSKPLLQL